MPFTPHRAPPGVPPLIERHGLSPSFPLFLLLKNPSDNLVAKKHDLASWTTGTEMGQALRQVTMSHGPVRASEQSGNPEDRQRLAQGIVRLRVMLRVALPWVRA